jgi:hypothetical protein
VIDVSVLVVSKASDTHSSAYFYYCISVFFSSVHDRLFSKKFMQW